MAMPAYVGQGPGPWTIPPDTTADERQAALQAIAVAGERDPAVRAVARELTVRADAECGALRCDPREMLANRARSALALVHTLPWRDQGNSEVYQSVGRTLRTGGNCHDFSPTLVALLHLMGIPSAMVTWLTQPKASINHVLVQLNTGRGWCWAETTVKEAMICEDPYDAERRLDGKRNSMGHVPPTVRAPKAMGQAVAIAVDSPQPAQPAPAPVAAVTPPPVTTQPMPLRAAQPGPAKTAPMGKPHASAGFGDPCAEAWRAYVAVRSRPMAMAVFPATPSASLRLSDGRTMPSPAGATTGFTYAAYAAVPVAQWQRRALLLNALRTWSRGVGIDPARIDGGALYDWLNVASLALDVTTQATMDASQGALAAYRACRAAGGVDAAAVVPDVAACARWIAMSMPARHALLRGYLVAHGFDVALPDASVHAMSLTVDRHCASQASLAKTIATAPKRATGMLRRF